MEAWNGLVSLSTGVSPSNKKLAVECVAPFVVTWEAGGKGRGQWGQAGGSFCVEIGSLSSMDTGYFGADTGPSEQ
jgi:hypothetical protein